jgi:hypothetical protein
MTENFAERLVDHRNIRLAAKRVSKLALHQRERGFNVAAMVLALQELLLLLERTSCCFLVVRALPRGPQIWGLESGHGNRCVTAALVSRMATA